MEMTTATRVRAGAAWLAVATLLAGCSTTLHRSGRDVTDRAPALRLREVGSFYVGGRETPLTAVQTGIFGPGSTVTDQMYVQYMLPQRRAKGAVVMIHGAGLSGKSYETTPDGRMGWYEYFARRGYGSYVVDQVGRARSGFNSAPFNDVRAGKAPPTSQPNVRRVGSETAMVRFRIKSLDGGKFGDTKFPVEHGAEFAKQQVPDLTEGYPPENPNYAPLSELARRIGGAVLIGHSQGGRFPFEAALLEPKGISAMVALEPGGCKATEYTDQQISQLARIPILIVFGDHLAARQVVGIMWDDAFRDCQAFVSRVVNAGGAASLYHPPDHGIHGNSHMIMQDKNNLQIADVIIGWLRKHMRRAP